MDYRKEEGSVLSMFPEIRIQHLKSGIDNIVRRKNLCKVHLTPELQYIYPDIQNRHLEIRELVSMDDLCIKLISKYVL